jgi:5-dehydro-2-deoxygluconokinase
VEAARRDGRDRVGLIVLGRGEDEKKVIEWLRVAATVPGFIGFAVGRSTFLQTIIDLRAGKIARDAGVQEIARRFREWIDVFESARASV